MLIFSGEKYIIYLGQTKHDFFKSKILLAKDYLYVFRESQKVFTQHRLCSQSQIGAQHYFLKKIPIFSYWYFDYQINIYAL